MPPPRPYKSRHFYMLDLCRGLAAYVVLIFHYQHFFLPSDLISTEAIRAQQPLYWLLWPIYGHGWNAVQFFWLVSGFVFAAVYIGTRSNSREFFVNRLARLYPLHFITLLVMAALQSVSLAALGRLTLTEIFDLKHFAMHIFLASNWVDTTKFSFNGPIWSVSLEVLFYAVFWVSLPFLYRKGVVGPALLATAFWLAAFLGEPFYSKNFQCGFYFFAGTICFLLSTGVSQAKFVWAIAFSAASFGIIATYLMRSLWSSTGTPGVLIAALLCAVLLEPYCHRLARRVRWIGDNTYSIYLWHFPMTVATIIIMDAMGYDRAALRSPWALAVYVGLVSIVAWVSFKYIETPARSYIRAMDRRTTDR